MCIATFNLEKLDDGPDAPMPLAAQLAILRPQLQRLRADVLCLQEVNVRRVAGAPARVLTALDRLVEGTPLASYQRAVSGGPSGPADAHNLVVLSRFPILGTTQHLHDLVAPPDHALITAEPAVADKRPLRWDRPVLVVDLALPGGRTLHVVNVHFKVPLAANIAGQKLEPFVWRNMSG